MAVLVQIKWVANPLRGDVFAEGWRPAAEAVMDFGARSWAFYRNQDGRLDFVQEAVFENKSDFDRYWYSETIAEYRTQLAGKYQVPLLPTFWEIVGDGVSEVTRA